MCIPPQGSGCPLTKVTKVYACPRVELPLDKPSHLYTIDGHVSLFNSKVIIRRVYS